MSIYPLRQPGDSDHETPIGRLFAKWHTEKARIDAANNMSDEDGIKAVEVINGYVREALGQLPITPSDFWRLAIMSLDNAGCLDGTFEEQFLARAHAEINGNRAGGTKSGAQSLSDCQHDALTLTGMLESVDLMNNEGELYEEARTATTRAAIEKARRLYEDLEELKKVIAG